MIMAETKTLASISEYGEDSRATSYTGLSDNSYSIGCTRSGSIDSLQTLTTTTTNRSYKNGYNGERKKTIDNSMTSNSQRRREKTMAQKRNYELCKKVRVTMALIGILLLVAAIFMLSFYLPKQYGKKKYTLEPVKIKRVIWDDNVEIEKDLMVLFSNNFSAPILKSEVGPDIALKGYFGEFLSNASRKEFLNEVNKGNDSISITFKGDDSHTSLTISKVDFHDQCYQVHWKTKREQRLQDCFDTSDSHWFGLGETFLQVWPSDKVSYAMAPFITNDYLGMENTKRSVFAGVLEPFAVNSKGAGIYVSEKVNLHVGMNENNQKKFCLLADSRSCIYDNEKENQTNELNYTICVAENIRKVHKIMFDQFIEKPMGVPDERMIKEPIWSTWANFKKQINQSAVLDFAEKIKKHNFESSHIIIDDSYSSQYGDFNFDPVRFNDISYMINRLRVLGFRTLVWMTPFTNLQSKNFIEALNLGVQVGSKKYGRYAPGIVTWWNGRGSMLDLSNPDAKNFYFKKLIEFMKLNIDGFKFDGGEASYLPAYHILKEQVPNPNYYTKYYVEMASEFDLSEVRVGYKSQKYPVFVRLLDRRTDWSSHGGLRSVLAATLTFSILGYSFVIPDMVGGNQYITSVNKELFVRWAQLSAFLPAIQFSVPPWQFNEEILTIVHETLEIRRNLSSYIYEVAKNVSITGEPIIRPLWWYWPKDPDAFVIDDEFMLGDRYLVAPVLSPNMIRNAIFLPSGVWEEQWGEKKTINNTVGKFYHYDVDLKTVCYFKLLQFLSPIT